HTDCIGQIVKERRSSLSGSGIIRHFGIESSILFCLSVLPLLARLAVPTRAHYREVIFWRKGFLIKRSQARKNPTICIIPKRF
ncbi:MULTISPECIES: hypothetical protein, partial [unclassified Salinivibrio]|uniref:hypothetical protein n=1 Tax=unclassified Salinivibrio TaxID=2636825 RepID=UPI001A7E13CA